MKTRVHVLISGQVHGVWFRASTCDKAEQLGLTGWVRNTSDGKVEAVFEGDDNQVKEMITWCHRGPPLAEVTHVDVKQEPPSNSFDEFSIKY